MTSTLKSHLLNLLVLLVAIFMFMPPLIKGYKISSHDMLGWRASAEEWFKYNEKGEDIKWTSRVFSGMPLNAISSKTEGNLITSIYINTIAKLDYTVYTMILLMLSIYLALNLLGIPPIVGLVVSLGFGFNTWVLDSVYASHGTKIINVGLNSLILASFIKALKEGKIKYYTILSFSLALSIIVFHIQVTYYGALICLIVAIYYFYISLKSKTLKPYFTRLGISVLFVALAILVNTTSLYKLNHYSQETMRGGRTELTNRGGGSTSSDGGLDINYAFDWSYTLDELFNFVIPDAKGGSSNYSIDSKKSELAKAAGTQDDKITLPLYWGEQPFTGAPNYIGILLVILLLYYLVTSKSNFRWLLLSLIIISMTMGLGKNLFTNELLFKYLPMYNKFRTPTMAFSIANIAIAIGAALGYRDLIFTSDIEYKPIIKKISIVLAGLFLLSLFVILGSNFSSPRDNQILQQNPNFPLNLLIEDRKSLFKSDVFRAIILSFIILGIIYYYLKSKFQTKYLHIALLILMVFDMWSVGKRYFSNDVFVDENYEEILSRPQPYDSMLMADNSYFRIFNNTVSSFNDNTDCYKYNSIGGYSPAKLYRYQDMIDVHLLKGNINVFNMLNCKYFIVQDQNGQKQAQLNTGANGNAWFVKNIIWVKNADDEIDTIGTINTKEFAAIDIRYKSKTNFTTTKDSSSSIILSDYNPDLMIYKSKSSDGGFAVFSEICYKENEDWKAFLDGKEVPIVRTNYILRGLYVPKGEHKIEFKYEISNISILSIVSMICSIILLLFIAYVLFEYYKSKQSPKLEDK